MGMFLVPLHLHPAKQHTTILVVCGAVCIPGVTKAGQQHTGYTGSLIVIFFSVISIGPSCLVR